MILCVDIGNTNIVLGCFDDENIKFISRISSDKKRMPDQYAVEISNILSLYNVSQSEISGAVIGSVVPSLTEYLRQAVKRLFNIEPMIIDATTKINMNIKLENPLAVGADLVAAAVGAKAKHGFPLIIIDMGTATTLTAIDKNGDFLGGSIIPGLRTSTDALIGNTSLLHGFTFDAPKNPIGRTTSDALKSGAILGTAAMLDGLCDLYNKQLGAKAKIVATGGLASKVIPFCKHDIILDDMILLDGLKEIYEINIPKGNN